MPTLTRVLHLLPALKPLLQGLKPVSGTPWPAYERAKRTMSQYVGWEADPKNLGHLTQDQEDFVTGSQAYEAMIKSIADRLGV